MCLFISEYLFLLSVASSDTAGAEVAEAARDSVCGAETAASCNCRDLVYAC